MLTNQSSRPLTRRLIEALDVNVKRPGGFTVLSLMFGWLSIAGFLNAWGGLSGAFEVMPKPVAFLALIYAIAAGAAAIQLWRFRPSAIIAIRSWMAVCGLFIITLSFFFWNMILGGSIGLLSFGVFVGALFFFLDRYVQRKLVVAN